MTTQTGHFGPAAWAAGLFVVLAGCSGGPRLYPVEGVVAFDDGTPAAALAGGTVSLESVADKSNFSGTIGPDGSFRVKTPVGKEGVPAGTYRVLVQPPEGADRNRPPIDRKYARYETSGIEITVKNEPTKIEVRVQKPKS